MLNDKVGVGLVINLIICHVCCDQVMNLSERHYIIRSLG